MLFTEHPVGRALRLEVWDRLDALFKPGMRVLDIGCGTGADAIQLAKRGVQVIGLEPSKPMIEIAKRRAAEAGVSDRVMWVNAPAKALSSADSWAQLASLATPLDGILANFGVLNCLDEVALGELAAALADRCNPGAPWIAVTMGRFCAWETAWYLLRGDPKRAFRRLGRDGVETDLGSGTFRVRYHSTRRIENAVQPWFAPVGRVGLGAIVPPTYAAAWLVDRPTLLSRLIGLERYVSGAAPIAGMADHTLLVLERTTAVDTKAGR